MLYVLVVLARTGMSYVVACKIGLMTYSETVSTSDVAVLGSELDFVLDVR
jgi:hypothetical protein